MSKDKEEKIKESEEAFAEMAEAKEEDLEIENDENKSNKVFEGEGQLTVDVYQDGDEIFIESTVAGVDPSELDINITSDSVTIRGERGRKREVDDKDYFYQECFWGTFSRSIILPEEVDPENSEAKITDNGVLTIRLPKLKRKSPKKVNVKVE
jgi:HSP20 family protein